MTLKKLEELVGGKLSAVSKMPGNGFSLPAEDCPTGSKLVKVKGSVCSSCYALKGRYQFPKVKAGLKKRLKAVKENPLWEFHMVELIKKKDKCGYFRIHPSGYFISLTYLRKWVFIAESLPDIKFWGPTREVGLIKQYRNLYGDFPDNLVIRVSNHMIDGHSFNGKYAYTSSVVTKISGKTCPATIKGNDSSCAGNNCTNCWDRNVPHINYFLH